MTLRERLATWRNHPLRTLKYIVTLRWDLL